MHTLMTITWDFDAVAMELNALANTLLLAGSAAILAALGVFGLYSMLKVLGLFRRVAEPKREAWRDRVPPLSGSWRGDQEGWENDWRGRHPKAFHGKW
ncbi:MAG: hypothetical protein JWM32_1200 [Verrucomicrobia bacterium]|nr:hypothetical protein [Verrucomicrobiota bacterium]